MAAPTTLYVASSGGNNNNSGSSEGSPKLSGVAAVITLDTALIDLSTDNPDLTSVVINQDTIRLNGKTTGRGGLANNDIYLITAKDNGAKTVTVELPFGTIAADAGATWAIGGAFATIRRAMGATEPSDVVYAKGTFTGLQDLSDNDFKNGGAPTTPITLEGYTTTPGDNGMCVLDGQNSTANGLVFKGGSAIYFYLIKNIWAKDYTNQCFRNALGGYPTKFINCRASGSGDIGFKQGAIVDNIRCYAHDNAGAGWDSHDHAEFYGCVATDNGIGIQSDDGPVLYRCLLINNAIGVKVTDDFRNDRTRIIDTIIDGRDQVGSIGVQGFDDAYHGNTKIVNSIIINNADGVVLTASHGEWNTSLGNLFDNTDNYDNYETQELEVLTAPTFVNAPTDYTPVLGGSQLDAGWDIRQNQFATVTGDQPSIGGIDRVGAGSGAGDGAHSGWGWC